MKYRCFLFALLIAAGWFLVNPTLLLSSPIDQDCVHESLKDDAEGKREVRVHCQAPATNYAMQITAVWRVGDELWVVSQIEKKGDFGGQAITPIDDAVKVKADEKLAVKHYIAGKTWNWWDGVEAEFIDSQAALLKQMKKDKVEIDEVLHGAKPE